jgi:hypothetical protein
VTAYALLLDDRAPSIALAVLGTYVAMGLLERVTDVMGPLGVLPTAAQAAPTFSADD